MRKSYRGETVPKKGIIPFRASSEDIITHRKSIARELLALRKKFGIAKLRLQNETGLARPTITTLESGERSWSVDSEIIYRKYFESLSSN